MFGYGCGVTQYPQFYGLNLDKYQVLPRPYFEYFEGGNVEKLIKKLMLLLVDQAETFSGNVFKKG